MNTIHASLNSTENTKRKILIGSPIHQSFSILHEFLTSLLELNTSDFEIGYCFVDDNTDKNSIILLDQFSKSTPNVTIIPSYTVSEYVCDDFTHRWNNDLVAKVTGFKNEIIKFALENNYKNLFFIDSDIILHPKTLKRLVSTGKDIVSNIFWTKWNPSVEELPQVWLKDSYTLYDNISGENISTFEIEQKTTNFLNMLKIPGTYRVGGLGACTLISRKALLSGLNFNLVNNISFWGEDRHFCIRAVALGFELFVDTYYPSYHVYRSSDLSGISEFKRKNQTQGESL